MAEEQVYDSIANEYRESRWLLFRHFIERYSLMELLGDLRDRTVVDLACGEGVYARQFKRCGASEVTGVDISEGMIALAQAEERREPLGCRYVQSDAAAFAPQEPVDIVTAVYPFNYARTREDLDGFFRACYLALRPGGRLVGFNDNVRRPPRPGESLTKYGLGRACPHPPREGDPVLWKITNHDGRTFQFENYYLEPATYAAAAFEAGFEDFRWVDAMLEPSEHGDSYWDDFMAQAPLAGLTASRR